MGTVRRTALWEDEAMTTVVGTYYANIDSLRATGFASLLVVTSAGSLALTYEVSDDNTNWYTPEDTDGNGLGLINAAVTVGSKWITFPISPARYSRVKAILTVGDSTVSISYRQTEEI